MITVETITDIEHLRQVAVLLDRENQRLIKRVTKLTEELSSLRGQDAASTQREITKLLEQLQRNRQTMFGDSSERRQKQRGQTQSKPSKPQTGHGPRPQPHLPLEERTVDVPEEDRACNVCGGHLEEMKGQTEDSEEITVIERRFVMVKVRRKKYRCRCNSNVVTAPAPAKLRPGSRYTPDFAIEVAVGKYLDHLPLERQSRIMRREGLKIDSQTLWDQINYLAPVLMPSYMALSDAVNESPVVFADETWWRLMGKKNPGKKKWWVWSKCSWDAVFYQIRDNRAGESARHLLDGYAGIVMADGYSVYKSVDGMSPPYTLANCWSHVRRKYVECEANYPECAEVLDLLAELFAVEESAPRWNPRMPEKESAAALAARQAMRDEKSRPLVKAIRRWARSQMVLPESGIGRAIAYMLKLWPRLIAFLDDPRIPLDNNAAERALRGVVLGRKNHYGSRSKRGTEVAALFYSLLESAKLCCVEPKANLREAVYAALKKPGTVTLPSELMS